MKSEFGRLPARVIIDVAMKFSLDIRDRITGDYDHVAEVIGSKIYIYVATPSEGEIYLTSPGGKTITDFERNLLDRQRGKNLK
jgi:hypothetical protein